MSGKKQKVMAGWFDCSKCQKRFSRQLVTKHTDEDGGCRPVYPYLQNDKLVCLLNNVSSNTSKKYYITTNLDVFMRFYRLRLFVQRKFMNDAEYLIEKIGDLPFIKDKRLASSTLFMSEDLIRECKFTTFGWISLNPLTSQCAKNSEDSKGEFLQRSLVVSSENDIPSSCYAFRVWPIPESIGSNLCNLQTVLSLDGFATNKIIPGNVKSDGSGDAPSGLAALRNLTSSLKDTDACFENASEITLVFNNMNEIDQLSFDKDRFIRTFRRIFQGRPVAAFNRFKIRFYSQYIHFYIDKISSYRETRKDDETFGLDKLSILEDSEKSAFYQIGATTVINIRTKENSLSEDKFEINSRISFNNIGGLHSVISEIYSAVNFILNTDLDVPRGILIHGHIGVGKTMVVSAVSNEFKLFPVRYEEFAGISTGSHQNGTGSSSLEKVFKDAISRNPSVVIIEALDVISQRKKSDTGAALVTPFVAQFTRLATSNTLKRSKVLILCTATDLDRVDPNIRSSKLFAKEIEIPIPSAPDREDILQKMLQDFNHTLSEENIKNISGSTHGFVAADLRSLCNQAALDSINSNNDVMAGALPITMRNIEECLKSVKPSAIKSILIDVPNVKWSDIGGQEDLKFKLKQAIEWPLKHPDSFKRLGITSPKGILMYGPPGCSKTMIAKAIATESGLNFISVKGSELFSKWVGESEKAVQAIFNKARQVAPCVIFFDEIDSLGGERGTSSGSSNVHERVLAQILVEMDGIETLKDVTIVAATNRPDRIDQALLRPGRLDRIIYVPLPDENTRKEILKLRFKKMPVDSQVVIDEIVKTTEGYSGAELTAVCHEAALKALEEDITCTVIKQNHFVAALCAVKPRITKEQIHFYSSYSASRKQN